MLKRLSSAISTAHAISLAIREAPDAIRECVEFARGNTELREHVSYWRNWAREFSGRDGTDTEIRTAVECQVQQIVNHWTAVCSEWRDKCEAAQNERDEFKTRVENQASEIAVLRNRVTELVGERDAAQKERDSVKCNLSDCASLLVAKGHRVEFLESKLARHEAAERWHQVTDGEGELPPPIPVLWEPNDPENHPSVNYPRVSIPGNSGTYRWRYLSSKDVSQ